MSKQAAYFMLNHPEFLEDCASLELEPSIYDIVEVMPYC